MLQAEAPWLQKRLSSEVYPLAQLLVNRLEVALWLAFFKTRANQRSGGINPSSSAASLLLSSSSRAQSVVPVALLQEKAGRLLAFASKLDPARQLAPLLDGLMAAQKLLLSQQQEEAPAPPTQAGPGGKAGTRVVAGSSSSSQATAQVGSQPVSQPTPSSRPVGSLAGCLSVCRSM